MLLFLLPSLAAGLASCTLIVDGQLANQGGGDAGPAGPRCDNTQQCLMISDRIFDCTQECIGNVCVTGRASPDGLTCGGSDGRQICVGATCVMRRCGDGYVDRRAPAAEYCDDGNDVDTDACNNDCTRSCVPPAPPNCSDGEPCNGEETCGSVMGVCRPAPALDDGAECTAPAGTGACRQGTCVVE